MAGAVVDRRQCHAKVKGNRRVQVESLWAAGWSRERIMASVPGSASHIDNVIKSLITGRPTLEIYQEEHDKHLELVFQERPKGFPAFKLAPTYRVRA